MPNKKIGSTKRVSKTKKPTIKKHSKTQTMNIQPKNDIIKIAIKNEKDTTKAYHSGWNSIVERIMKNRPIDLKTSSDISKFIELTWTHFNELVKVNNNIAISMARLQYETKSITGDQLDEKLGKHRRYFYAKEKELNKMLSGYITRKNYLRMKERKNQEDYQRWKEIKKYQIQKRRAKK